MPVFNEKKEHLKIPHVPGICMNNLSLPNMYACMPVYVRLFPYRTVYECVWTPILDYISDKCRTIKL